MDRIDAADAPLMPRRRQLLLAGAALAASATPLARAMNVAPAKVRSLSFDHTHTGEKLAVAYAVGDAYIPQALLSLNHLLRDFRTGDAHPIEPRLFDQLFLLARITGTQKPFQIISGYRSPATNTQLRSKSRGVASHSLHLDGKAIDVRLADVRLADLRDAALSMKSGGVGYYGESDFVHLDTGAVRRW
jgi:uncharacterized protein YcbK (DUF882 family)